MSLEVGRDSRAPSSGTPGAGSPCGHSSPRGRPSQSRQRSCRLCRTPRHSVSTSWRCRTSTERRRRVADRSTGHPPESGRSASSPAQRAAQACAHPRGASSSRRASSGPMPRGLRRFQGCSSTRTEADGEAREAGGFDVRDEPDEIRAVRLDELPAERRHDSPVMPGNVFHVPEEDADRLEACRMHRRELRTHSPSHPRAVVMEDDSGSIEAATDEGLVGHDRADQGRVGGARRCRAQSCRGYDNDGNESRRPRAEHVSDPNSSSMRRPRGAAKGYVPRWMSRPRFTRPL